MFRFGSLSSRIALSAKMRFSTQLAEQCFPRVGFQHYVEDDTLQYSSVRKARNTGQQENYSHTARMRRILVLGDAGVGKTSYIRKRLSLPFEPLYLPTSGIQQYATDDTIYYDCAGGEWCFRHQLPPADVVIYMFDVTDSRSYQNLSRWRQLGFACSATHLVIGSKADLESASCLPDVDTVTVSNK